MERYILTPSKEPYCWVCTDTELGIVVSWNELDFNVTQEVTMLDDATAPNPAVYARAMQRMTEWILRNHRPTIFPDVKRILGQRLHDRREDLGLSLIELSERSGLSVNNIARIEQGRYNYTIDILSQLCDFLDLGIDLFDGEEEDD